MSAPTVDHVTFEVCVSGFMIVGAAGEAMTANRLIRVSTKLVLLLDSIQNRCLGYHVMLINFWVGQGRAKAAAEDAQVMLSSPGGRQQCNA